MDNCKAGTAYINMSEYLELLKMKENVLQGKFLVIESVDNDFIMSQTYSYYTENEMCDTLINMNAHTIDEYRRVKEFNKKLNSENASMKYDIVKLTGKLPPVANNNLDTPCITDRLKEKFVKELSFWQYLKIKFNK